jgi:hypothetical protein
MIASSGARLDGESMLRLGMIGPHGREHRPEADEGGS